jgi:SNF2 family DNA or RNA helicase
MRYLQHDKLDRYLVTNAGNIVINKAKNIVRWGKFMSVELNLEEGGKAKYRVRSEQYSNIYYDVVLQNFLGPGSMSSSCSCNYSRNYGGLCKHAAAMMMILDEHEALSEPAVQYNMTDCEVRLTDLSDTQLRQNTSDLLWKARLNLRKVDITKAADGFAECTVTIHTLSKEPYTVRFQKKSAEALQSSCTCGESLFDPLCAHKLAALLALREQYGILAFEVMRDWSAEKNRLLAEYGFSLEDNLQGKFDFKISDRGQLEMSILDKSIQAPGALGTWWSQNENRIQVKNQVYNAPKPVEEVEVNRILMYALSIQEGETLPDIILTPLSARYQADKDKLSHVTKLDTLHATNYGNVVEIPPISEIDSRLIRLARTGFSVNAMLAALREAGFPMTRWYYQNMPVNELTDDMRQVALNHIGQVWDQLIPMFKDHFIVVSPDQHFHLSSLERINIQPQAAKPFFQLYEEGEFVVLQGFVMVQDDIVPVQKCKNFGFWFLKHQHKLVKIARYNDATLLQRLGPPGQFKVKKDYLSTFLTDFVLPLTAHYSVDFNIDLPVEYQELSYQEGRIYLKEDDTNLIFVPTYAYRSPQGPEQTLEFLSDGKHERIAYEAPKIVVWDRDTDAEKAFDTFFQSLHPDFAFQAGRDFYYLPFSEILKEQWLFKFIEAAKEKGAPVFGFQQLKKFKYNPNRPSFKIRASSGIDWFDMKMEISFGDQHVALADVKKAVLNKQNYIQLGDGTFGMLPEDWLERYAGLFKFGQIKGESLKVSKLHFSVIDDLYDQIDDVAIQQELWEKKHKLLNFREIEEVPLPANITANLRDYQKEGFKWLNFLDEFRWGGCLADDMGLGKTVQILTFLQHRKNIKPDAVNLVVVPTTLLFNWQAEVEKFTPELRIYVHRGVTRERDLEILKDYDLVLTTYGTLRSDIETFKDIRFDYVVLDESQAIKNPDSKIAKAVKLLDTKNRLVMTGTPVENNTFDLYSQMEFLNPGLLGSQEFFRAEFATPIDKYRDEEKARQLRKLIYPFMLKRTKEEVAKDLPDKTETILFCEMGVQQRKVYDTFREQYRLKIVEKMAEEGKDKAAFLILEGLLKLRQICDSPALLSDDVDYGEDSAKLEEIIREIEENAGNHKILIFSQFLKMLDLVRRHLEKSGIPYEYLDGSTQDRAARVRNFQESVHCRVFLMSLKAGGVGINLTEADYVYLVDPWWNPAVEQQAIDRTHRIGQTKKVFAYKMICKDTVEEKILQLQDKKKDIAKELISTEQGLIKKLTQDDIVGLFS